jgi:hypothetical protein
MTEREIDGSLSIDEQHTEPLLDRKGRKDQGGRGLNEEQERYRPVAIERMGQRNGDDRFRLIPHL